MMMNMVGRCWIGVVFLVMFFDFDLMFIKINFNMLDRYFGC